MNRFLLSILMLLLVGCGDHKDRAPVPSVASFATTPLPANEPPPNPEPTAGHVAAAQTQTTAAQQQVQGVLTAVKADPAPQAQQLVPPLTGASNNLAGALSNLEGANSDIAELKDEIARDEAKHKAREDSIQQDVGTLKAQALASEAAAKQQIEVLSDEKTKDEKKIAALEDETSRKLKWAFSIAGVIMLLGGLGISIWGGSVGFLASLKVGIPFSLLGAVSIAIALYLDTIMFWVIVTVGACAVGLTLWGLYHLIQHLRANAPEPVPAPVLPPLNAVPVSK